MPFLFIVVFGVISFRSCVMTKDHEMGIDVGFFIRTPPPQMNKVHHQKQQTSKLSNSYSSPIIFNDDENFEPLLPEPVFKDRTPPSMRTSANNSRLDDKRKNKIMTKKPTTSKSTKATKFISNTHPLATTAKSTTVIVSSTFTAASEPKITAVIQVASSPLVKVTTEMPWTMLRVKSNVENGHWRIRRWL